MVQVNNVHMFIHNVHVVMCTVFTMFILRVYKFTDCRTKVRTSTWRLLKTTFDSLRCFYPFVALSPKAMPRSKIYSTQADPRGSTRFGLPTARTSCGASKKLQTQVNTKEDADFQNPSECFSSLSLQRPISVANERVRTFPKRTSSRKPTRNFQSSPRSPKRLF